MPWLGVRAEMQLGFMPFHMYSSSKSKLVLTTRSSAYTLAKKTLFENTLAIVL
jgi:hypothetical protein